MVLVALENKDVTCLKIFCKDKFLGRKTYNSVGGRKWKRRGRGKIKK
jgi:hypothetical protein